MDVIRIPEDPLDHRLVIQCPQRDAALAVVQTWQQFSNSLRKAWSLRYGVWGAMTDKEAVECEACGQLATVRSLTPVFDRSEPAAESGASAPMASMVIECPVCGVRTQIVEVDGE